LLEFKSNEFGHIALGGHVWILGKTAARAIPTLATIIPTPRHIHGADFLINSQNRSEFVIREAVNFGSVREGAQDSPSFIASPFGTLGLWSIRLNGGSGVTAA